MATDQPSRDQVSRNEMFTVLKLVVIVVVMLAGREIGSTYSGLDQIKTLEIGVNVEEEALARYLRDTLAGMDAELKIGVGIAIPGAVFAGERQSVQIPDYAKGWVIAVTLNPVTFLQPEVSDFEVTLLIEGEVAAEQTFTFPRAKVGFVSTLDREMSLHVTEKEKLLNLITASAVEHGGETQITLMGRCRAHYSFLETWLPFTVTKYPFVSTPLLKVNSNSWRNIDNTPTLTLSAGQPGYVIIAFNNPARLHSLSDTITCTITREGGEAPAITITKTILIAPQSDATLFFPFTLTKTGVYSFAYTSVAGLSLPGGQSPHLTVQQGG
jgi:hypothetical protein